MARLCLGIFGEEQPLAMATAVVEVGVEWSKRDGRGGGGTVGFENICLSLSGLVWIAIIQNRSESTLRLEGGSQRR